MPAIMKMQSDSPQRHRRRRLRYIAVLPTLLTLGNLLCGFSAIHFGLRAMFAAGHGSDAAAKTTLDSQFLELMLPSYLAIGAMLIFLGMAFDMLDGLAARIADNASDFGTQVDSLADVVTFGVAPAILTVALMISEWHLEDVMVTPLSEQPIGRAMWVCAAAYCLCAAVRLARFNVEHADAEASHRSFRGLPSPGAAAVLASIITLHQHVGPGFGQILLYSLPVVSLGCGFLMLSRIRYERITHAYLLRRRPFEHLIAFVVIFVLFWSYKPQALAIICLLYALSGPVMSVARRVRGDRSDRKDRQDQDTSGSIPTRLSG